MRKPENLKQMQVAMELYRKLRDEVPIEEEAFPAIEDQMLTLDKYAVVIPDDVRTKQKNIPAEWQRYLETLDQADKMLTYAKVVLQEMGKI